MAFEDGPYIQLACFCDVAIQEAGTGVLSIIRVIDTVTRTVAGPNPPDQMPPLVKQLTLVLAVKSGRARGRYDLRIVPELPSGETLTPIVQTIHLEGEEKGHNHIANIHFKFEQEGLYWFNVYLDDQKWTAIPFRVRYSRSVRPQPT
jgi:hypothetical protein